MKVQVLTNKMFVYVPKLMREYLNLKKGDRLLVIPYQDRHTHHKMIQILREDDVL